METDNDVLASCDELDEDDGDLPTLERVKEIITEPEEKWRYTFNDEEAEDGVSCCGSLGNFSTTSKPELIQPKLDTDILSMFKVSSAAQWKSISSNVEISLTEEESIASKDCDNENENPSETKVPDKVTRQQLLAVCWQVRPWECPKDRRLFTSLYAEGWGCDCDEVSPGLFIGDRRTAENTRLLAKLGITHVLNAAEGPWEEFGFVNLNQQHFADKSSIYQAGP